MRTARKVIAACVVGTSLEWYDFFLYGSAAALVFGELFFPAADPVTASLLAFATYGVGFVARPIGGVIFGHFGDRVGRRDVFALTLLVMGLGTFLIGLLPTYATIGVVAPVLLVVLRFGQGLSLGGQWGGAAVLSLEHSPGRWRGLATGLVQAGVPAGNLLAAGVLGLFSLVLSDAAFTTWGWRVPFLLSGALALVGLWIRLRVAESPLFAQVDNRSRRPLAEAVGAHRPALVSAFCARIGVDVAYYIFTLYLLIHLTEQVGTSRDLGLYAVFIGSALQLLLIPLFGSLSDRIGRRPVYLAGVAGAAVWVFAFFALLESGSFPLVLLAVGVALVAHAAMYGPQAAFIAERFPIRVRYSGTSLGYQLAGVAGGALAPILAILLLDRFGSTLAISLYVVAALTVTAVGVLAAPAAVPDPPLPVESPDESHVHTRQPARVP